MRKATYAALALGLVLVSGPVFAEEVPLVIQTPEKDASVTEKAEKKHPQTLKKRVEISKDATITIYYEAGDDSQNPQNTKEAKDEKRRAQERRIKEIFDNAMKLGFAEHSDLLSDGAVAKIDALMREYLNIILDNPSLVGDWNMLQRIGLMGNRLIIDVESILGRLPTRETVSFYAHYLTSTMARTEDYPNEKEKKRVIQIMTEIILASGENNFIITHKAAEEMKQIDSETYESLHREGKIIF